MPAFEPGRFVPTSDPAFLFAPWEVHVRLSEALLGLGHAVPFYPRLAVMVGNPFAALLLAQLFYLTQNDSDNDGWVKRTDEQLTQALGIKRDRLTRARARLMEIGVLESHKNGEHATHHYRVDWDALESLWVSGDTLQVTSKELCGKPADHFAGNQQRHLILKTNTKTNGPKSDQTALIVPVATIPRIRDGVLDHIPKGKLVADCDPMLSVMLDYWKQMWGLTDSRIRMTDERRKIWRKSVREGWLPSDWVKAIRGMRFDTWDERAKHNDWQHILRNMEKWLRLDSENDGRAIPSLVNDADTKTVRGIRVPKQYQWSSKDDYCLENGWKFEEGVWVRPSKTVK